MTYDLNTLQQNWDAALEAGQDMLARTRDLSDQMTDEERVELYDRALSVLSTGGALAELMSAVHPEAEVRDSAETYNERFSAVYSSISVDRALYDAFRALDLEKLSDEARRFVTHELEDFVRGGITRDEETRSQLKALLDEMKTLGIEFDRHIRDGRQTMTVQVEELKGLPESFITSRCDEDGVVTLSTDYTDTLPVLMYAEVRETRRRLSHLSNNRAYPQNMDVFRRLLEKRQTFARILGYKNWADYITDDKMAGSGDRVAAFIADVVTLAEPLAREEKTAALEVLREVNDEATALESYDRQFAMQRLAARQCGFDPATVRAYFHYDAVRDGVLEAAERLFGVEFCRNGRELWHPSVQSYNVYDSQGGLIGRFCLDMHPRDGKYSHAAAFPMTQVTTKSGLPELCLVCNFADPGTSDGLMEHGDVVTFFHEFGHLMHHILGSDVRFASEAGFSCEWDFVETPSQVFEAWAWQADVLKNFAKHHETGEVISDELIEKMNQADQIGRGIGAMRQMQFATLSLALHQREATSIDLDAVTQSVAAKASPFPYDETTHPIASFGHLNDYSAIYYTYMWSFVCTLEVLGVFREHGLNDRDASRRYIREIISRGGSVPAEDMMRAFLGRPWNTDVLAPWLRGEV